MLKFFNEMQRTTILDCNKFIASQTKVKSDCSILLTTLEFLEIFQISNVLLEIHQSIKLNLSVTGYNIKT
jgi:hypothetical protein